MKKVIETTHESFNYKKYTFEVIKKMFDNNYLVKKIQIDTYNDFIEVILPTIIEQYNPLSYKYYNEEDEKTYVLETVINNPRMIYPTVCDNDGTVNELTTTLSRLRNYSYSSKLVINITKKTSIFDKNNKLISCDEVVMNEIIIGKIPIMVNSKFCLNNKITKDRLNECAYDAGGYFIINGVEKVIVLQERCIDNQGLVFYQKNSKYKYILELKSSIKNAFMPTKPLYIKLYSKDNTAIYSNYIRITMPYFKQDIPLFIIMRVLGFESDMEILKTIVLDLNDKLHTDVLNILESSIEDANNIKTQEDALDYVSENLTNVPKDVKNKEKLYEYIHHLFKTEYIPHIGECYIKKGLYTGMLVLKLIQCSLGLRDCDDRDSYLNKRVDSTGVLLGALFRQYYSKMIKEFKTLCNKEYNNGSWKATDNFHSIVNSSNIYKLIKPTIIENGMKFALATGNFGIKNTFNKQGISQLFNKMSFNSIKSHLRRVNTPIEKCGKLVPPRKQHGTQWGYICPAETPEGQSVGVVKNISLSTIVSINTSLLPITKLLEKFDLKLLDDIKSINNIDFNFLSHNSKIFLNGEWYACTNNIIEIYNHLLNARRNCIINIYTSIVFDKFQNELYIYTDAGRLLRPLYILENGKFIINDQIGELIKRNKLNWNSLLGISNFKYNIAELDSLSKQEVINKINIIKSALVEYIDPAETSTLLISMDENIKDHRYTHCEIHPFLILGAIASTIPFPDHNQSPRNTYQSAMGKQAIGICATNYRERLDTISHLLYYPQKPIITTKSMPYLNTLNMPSGINAIIAIMTYTGYNQEDSVLMNEGAIKRGLFLSAHLKTYKEEEKKNQNSGDEEKFCIPNEKNTINYKLANYSKLDTNGIIKENTYVSGNDVIIGKVIPHKKNKNKEHVFKDNSIILKGNEAGSVFKVYVGINGDGYNFCKVQIKNERYPQIGDKFSSRMGQKGTVGMVYKQEDMPFTKDGITPDLIVNPHAIPSRMTIGQLLECILGKTCSMLGMEGDSTPFTDMDPKKISDILSEQCGFEPYGNEVLYNGMTGEQLMVDIFIGPTYYQRLKHMVIDKYHSRSTGPIVLLTRQPAEGRTRDGGLRFGEMERDCIISHGCSSFLKERLLDVSDNYKVYICSKCHMIGSVNPSKNIYKCDHCPNTTLFKEIRIPFACKLLMQELISMSIVPRLICD